MSDSHAPSAPVSSSVTPELEKEISHRLATYKKVGVVQVGFSFATVIAAYLFHGAFRVVAVLGLASINAAMVAAIMMHLKQEKKIIWNFLYFTGIFLVVIFFLTYLAHSDPIIGTNHTHH
jgi:caa(3)-type oxidase subunit IV